MNSELEFADLQFNDEGIPYSRRFGDVYHARQGAMAQSQAVFLAGCGLPQAWSESPEFTIVETGFGLGLNFLSTVMMWQRTAREGQTLRYVAVEKYPPDLDALRVFHTEVLPNESTECCAYRDTAEILYCSWPDLKSGVNRIVIPEAMTITGSAVSRGSVLLSLYLGDIVEELARISRTTKLVADAIFLDGFSPAVNPGMWSSDVFSGLARISRHGSRIATWSVAGSVRRGLKANGFSTQKVKGFGGKKERLTGHFVGSASR